MRLSVMIRKTRSMFWGWKDVTRQDLTMCLNVTPANRYPLRIRFVTSMEKEHIWVLV